MKNFFRDKKGQSLLEVIVAMAIFALIGAAMASLSIGGFVSMDVGGEQTEAESLAQGGLEAVRAIRDRAWNELSFNTTTVSTSSGQWVLGTEGATEQIGNYKRTISLEDVCRDVGNNIVTCPGTYTDVQTKKITSQIDWPVRNTTNTVKQVSYLTNWDTSNWTQTNWVGGGAQNLWSDQTKYLSDDSNLDIATAGQVQLKYTAGSGCGQMIWDFANSGQYNFDFANLEVTGGFGQLKDLGSCSGATSTCATYLNQTACTAQVGCSWTSVYSSTAETIRNTNSYNPSQIGFWGGFTETATKNGGEIYYQLSSDDGVTWKYWNGSIWATSTLATNYNLATVVNTNIATFATSSKKIMFKAFLLGNGTQQVKLDQVQINCVRENNDPFDTPANYSYDSAKIVVTSSQAMLKDIGGASYPTSSPGINQITSLSVPTTTFFGWTGFVETATTNGGSISYQLSNDDGSTWQYWNGSAWSTAGVGNYNPATTINSNIATFNTSTGKLMFKAFLTSNGSQLVQLDNIKITWMENVGTSGYALFGSLISSAFNMNDVSPANVIAWTQDVSTCTNCAVKLQVRTAPNSGGVPGTWSSWYGVIGAGTYFTDYHGQMIPKVLNWNQWVQYQAELTSDGNTTPILKDVIVYYK